MNLIIDGSFLTYKTLFSMIKKISPSRSRELKISPFLSREDEKKIFIKKMNQQIATLLKKFPTERCIFTLDGPHTWRKKISNEYKSTRRVCDRDKSISWDDFFIISTNFLFSLEKFGIITAQYDAAEADDLIYFFVNFFKKMKKNSIIVATDKDLLQLIATDVENKNFTALLSDFGFKKILYVDENFSQLILNKSKKLKINLQNHNFENFFHTLDDINEKIINKNTYDDDINTIISLKKNKEIIIKEINPHDVILNKIFFGDVSDNILKIFEEKKINRRFLNLIKSHFDIKKLNQILINISENKNPQILKEILKTIEEKTKLSLDEEKILQNLKNNINLILLDEKIIPPKIKEYFQEIEKNTFVRINDFLNFLKKSHNNENEELSIFK